MLHSEAHHTEMREAILSFMLSIEHLLVGYDSDGHANYLVPLQFNSVQEYIDNTRMSSNRQWGTELEIMCLSHNIMFNVNMFSFYVGSNTWSVFSPINIERTLSQDFTTMSVYIYLRHAHFYVVSSIRRTIWYVNHIHSS